MYTWMGLLTLASATCVADWNAMGEPLNADRRAARDCGCMDCDCFRCESGGARTCDSRWSAAFDTYRAVDRAARMRGGYRPGQQVLISIGQASVVNRAWQQWANQNGWTFCVHDRAQPGLEVGVSRHVADSQGRLYPAATRVPVAHLADDCATGRCARPVDPMHD